ncbi:claudin-34 [Betta splendens]|uniref:Claudin-34 n=1 Tax=Betta splendens TaxID=158456 RepID=A0A6P7M651_BETSP|nr:claudin-34 [Betta splendens]XP_055363856.1 claudin-34 [Betta splendens]XP_055363857.1 claudin-34 [Betta splendens]XP_055363858.1 claudin-34 [Betta splendens]XP_055363859.1 claudin-34 [Betta splendens]XP_055363860.1 claudin-34 [Betta splendens]
MIYLADTAHWQFLGLVVGFLSWILTMITAGLNEWRLWRVADVSVVTSGVAWVGIWRACFYSHVLPSVETCRRIGLSDAFAPVEIPAAQVLVMLAVVCGLAGNVSAAVAVRMVYFSLDDRRSIRVVFLSAGTLYFLTAMLLLVPLVWNMNSVLNNSTIDFPPDFYLPAAPVSQQVGSAIGLGMVASILMLISSLLFLCYRFAWRNPSSEAPRDTGDPLNGPWQVTTLKRKADLPNGSKQGQDNPAFHTEEERNPS